MNSSEQQILTLLGDAVQNMSSLIENLGDRVEMLEGVMQTLQEPLVGTIASAGVSNIFSGMLLAELADGDHRRFDELMARTATFAEATAGGLDEPTKTVLLESLDTIVGIADDHFARGQR
ncbi:hypothetical protein [Sphingomonas sp.]|uniref:hypothetical protein n=1 Tax=Sphingomonas sp. TaxID=28214 RepID=UPI001ED14AB6|nr:hypothetical protein [Sphingomonas sp.]MBX3593008.1 hypothetical protein [Sphingomonas sp.]